MKNARNFVFELPYIAGTFIYEGISDKKEIDCGQQGYVRKLVIVAQEAVVASGKPMNYHDNFLMLANIAHIINSL